MAINRAQGSVDLRPNCPIIHLQGSVANHDVLDGSFERQHRFACEVGSGIKAQHGTKLVAQIAKALLAFELFCGRIFDGGSGDHRSVAARDAGYACQVKRAVLFQDHIGRSFIDGQFLQGKPGRIELRIDAGEFGRVEVHQVLAGIPVDRGKAFQLHIAAEGGVRTEFVGGAQPDMSIHVEPAAYDKDAEKLVEIRTSGASSR